MECYCLNLRYYILKKLNKPLYSSHFQSIQIRNKPKNILNFSIYETNNHNTSVDKAIFFTLSFLFTFFNTTLFAQQQNSLNNGVYTILDNNADNLLRKSKAYSVSIGLIKDGKVYTKHYGELDKGKGNKADNNTSFDVASVTKVMTGHLMAKAVLEKKVKLDDDIRKYLDGSYPNLAFQGIPVKIIDLVSFKTAFDREIPDNSQIRKINDDSTCFRIKKMDESYSEKQFLEDLKTIQLDTIPGKKHKYSNTSLELSALILEKVYHKNFETLLNEYFLLQQNECY
jgi:CubicO group peptidase (beta-lactamase class C family)